IPNDRCDFHCQISQGDAVTLDQTNGVSIRRVALAGILVLILFALSRSAPPVTAQRSRKVPVYKVDPFRPKPLPVVIDADGLSHHWVTGEVGATCVDSRDRIITI